MIWISLLKQPNNLQPTWDDQYFVETSSQEYVWFQEDK